MDNPWLLQAMQIKLRHIAIYFFSLSCLQTNGQTLLYDSLNVKRERNEYQFIIIPAYYEQLSKRFNLSDISDKDSFSIRLWTASMVGYTLTTFIDRNVHSYNYYSDTSIREIKVNSKISILDFLNKLQAFDFDNLISQYQIKDFKDDIDDGTLYTLEIIRGKTYKVFQYHSPELFRDIDNKKFSAIIRLCDQYFYTKN